MQAALDCAAVWGPVSEDPVPPEYRLSAAQKQELARAMPGCPITFEHMGISGALDKLESAGMSAGVKKNLFIGLLNEARSPGQGHKAPLGVVTDAWVTRGGEGECSLRLTSNAAQRMVKDNLIRSVSLTHGENGRGELVPVELTLCNVPARPGAFIFDAEASPEALAVYKASGQTHHVQAPARTMESVKEDAAMPATDDRVVIEKAWSDMPANARTLLAEQLRKIVAASKSAEAEVATLRAANEDLKRVQSGNMDLLERQLQILTAQVDPALLKRMGLNDCARTMADFKSDNSRLVADAALRTVICASRTLQMRGGSEAVEEPAPVSKRQAVAKEGGAPEPATPDLANIIGMPTAPAPAAPVVEESSQGALRDALNMAFA